MFTHQNSLAEPSHIFCALPCILDKLTMGPQWQIVLRDNEHISSIQASYIHFSSEDSGFNCTQAFPLCQYQSKGKVFKIVSFSLK